MQLGFPNIYANIKTYFWQINEFAMKTETLKINLAQRILDLSDVKLLKKIAQLLETEHVVGYDTTGNPIYEKDYVADIENSLQLFREDKLETYSNEEVKKQILGQ